MASTDDRGMNVGWSEWVRGSGADSRSRRLVWVIGGLQARPSPLLNVAAALPDRASSWRAAEFDLAWVLAHEFKLLVIGVGILESGGLFVS